MDNNNLSHSQKAIWIIIKICILKLFSQNEAKQKLFYKEQILMLFNCQSVHGSGQTIQQMMSWANLQKWCQRFVESDVDVTLVWQCCASFCQLQFFLQSVSIHHCFYFHYVFANKSTNIYLQSQATSTKTISLCELSRRPPCC